MQPPAFCFFTERFDADSDSVFALEMSAVMPVSHKTVSIT